MNNPKRTPILLRQCKLCDAPFFVSRRQSMIRYCSEECRTAGGRLNKKKWEIENKGKDAEQRRIKTCKNCGKVFKRPKGKSVKYCSKKCQQEGYHKLKTQSNRRKRRWINIHGKSKVGCEQSGDYADAEEKRISKNIEYWKRYIE